MFFFGDVNIFKLSNDSLEKKKWLEPPLSLSGQIHSSVICKGRGRGVWGSHGSPGFYYFILSLSLSLSYIYNNNLPIKFN